MPENDEQVMDLEQQTRSSITLKTSAKGEYYFEAKAYYEAKDADEALARLEHIDQEMRRRFRTAGGAA